MQFYFDGRLSVFREVLEGNTVVLIRFHALFALNPSADSAESFGSPGKLTPIPIAVRRLPLSTALWLSVTKLFFNTWGRRSDI